MLSKKTKNLSSNFGLTNVTEPDVLPAFEKLVKLGFVKNFFKSETLAKYAHKHTFSVSWVREATLTL